MRILITAPYNEQGQQILAEKLGEVIYRPWKDIGRAFNEDELIALLKETKANALITEHDHVTEKVIEANSHLQFIGVCRGTPSNVSLVTADNYGIPVFHTPARNAQAVAELFLATVIDLMRNTYAGAKWLKGKNWTEDAHTSYLQFKGNEMAGKTIGMVGFGAVGQRIAKMVESFPCAIKFYDPYLEVFDAQYTKTTIEDVFESCDIVSIHLPVNSSTIGMIDKGLISRMRPDAIFVNTARASVVKRDDLLDALENNRIRGAVLDVFDHEPPDEKDYRIINLPNVLATPHIAGATHEVEDHHVAIMNGKIMNWYAKEKVN
ncbi:D-3-phosphoglycerate dehydrogenase [Pedobacter sp. ok626]|uniref:NAD(P)-dependent oxidoreductase n=1 Tax=Pedobacter sp. ok626 TaxID=1761882 RepID=UPI00088F0F5E|nr:NAD(P)-dependent oxidoreductase [Pedobacter sp. ok626]SDL85323.1 D-3-phosphoglycerate dehydrogenase [Pedobacter sp. ok626]